MNTRGIPPTTYQVLHMLSYPGGYPIPGPSHPRHPSILTWPGGTPGTPPPHPNLVRDTPSCVPPPSPDLARGYPSLAGGIPHPRVPPNQEWGTPGKGSGTSHWGTPPWKGHGTSESIMGWSNGMRLFHQALRDCSLGKISSRICPWWVVVLESMLFLNVK